MCSSVRAVVWVVLVGLFTAGAASWAAATLGAAWRGEVTDRPERRSPDVLRLAVVGPSDFVTSGDRADRAAAERGFAEAFPRTGPTPGAPPQDRDGPGCRRPDPDAPPGGR